MPVRRIYCSICGKSISGYDFPERMEKLRHHYKEEHPKRFKASIKKGVATRKRLRKG